jgi:hypothetical protein
MARRLARPAALNHRNGATTMSVCALIQCWDKHLEEPSLELPVHHTTNNGNTPNVLIRAT